MKEKTLCCRECNTLFKFSANEQQFFAKKDWSDPCRCPDCRKANREHSRDTYYGWQSTMGGPPYAKRGHRRVHYSGLIIAGGLSN